MLKFLIVFSITYVGYPASMYLLLIIFASLSKSETILLAVQSILIGFQTSVLEAFLLSYKLPCQFLGHSLQHLETFFGLISNVNIMFSWYEFKSIKRLSVSFFFFIHKSHPHIIDRILDLLV